MLTLRDDQEDLRTKLRVSLRSNTSVLCYAPTGFGKTVLAAELIRLIATAGKTVIFCVHRLDLITQTAKTFNAFNIPFSYISSKHHFNPYHKVFIASIASLKNRMGKIRADYIIVDEAHLSMANGWKAVADFYKENRAKLIGLTGTPERLDGKPLGDVWNDMVMGPSVSWLIENKRLSEYRAFAPQGLVNLDGVHTRQGEYVTSEIDEIMSGKAVLSNAVQKWREFAGGKRTIAFTPSVARSEQLAQEFMDSGIGAIALDGNTPQDERIKSFHLFADKKIDVIVNCQLFCEGFDLAAQVDRDVTVEAVLQYSPTKSLAKHLQQLGRALRMKPEPAIILDLVGNISRLGLPDEDRDWSLAGRKKTGRETPVKICPECLAANLPSTKCPECGHVYEVKVSERELEVIDGGLSEINIAAAKKKKRQEQGRTGTLADLVALATARGYKSPEKWAAHVWTGRQAKRARHKKHGF